MNQMPAPSSSITEFNHLLIAEIPTLKNFARKFTGDSQDINDLVQDTLIKAIRFFEKFKSGTSLKAWLFVIMKNTYINSYRKIVTTRTKFDQVEDINLAKILPGCTARNKAESSFIDNDIKIALTNLPDHLYLPFKMYTDGYKYYEIAERIGVPIGTIKTRMHIGRIQLKKMLKDYHYYAQ